MLPLESPKPYSRISRPLEIDVLVYGSITYRPVGRCPRALPSTWQLHRTFLAEGRSGSLFVINSTAHDGIRMYIIVQTLVEYIAGNVQMPVLSSLSTAYRRCDCKLVGQDLAS